jgi:peptidoglycan/xylan/chitin deacetylase (PgdA/CDA1 family)
MRSKTIPLEHGVDAINSVHRVVFLMYHELEKPGRALSESDPGYTRYIVQLSDFRSQMELVKSKGWRGVNTGEAIRSFKEKTVAITFDDGCETDLLFVAPVLKEMGFNATLYITSGWLGRPGHLTHLQLRELSSLGFEIGCHSMNHVYLTDLDEAALRREIVDAKSQLEQIIGAPVEHLSCPGGRFNDHVAAAARNAGYLTVATSRIHANHSSNDNFALGRVSIMRDTSMEEFWNICQARSLWRLKMAVHLREAAMKILGNTKYDRLRGAMLRTRPPRSI